jgi:hypothetical protein
MFLKSKGYTVAHFVLTGQAIPYEPCFPINSSIPPPLSIMGCVLVAVIQALVALVHDPEPEHPLRADLAEEYSKDKKKFLKNAEEFTKKHGEKRPSD